MTFLELLSAAYEEANYQSSPASAVTTRIKRYLNEGQRTILAEPGLSRLADSDSPYTFATVASTARYVLPESVARFKTVTERTNDTALAVLSLEQYRLLDPDPTATTGQPTHLVPIGRVAVATQPSNASSLFVDSASASDTATAYLEGLVTGGYQRTASVTMTGTTAVDISTAISTWIEVTDFYLSANAVGTVTLHEDSGAGTELARITIGQKRPRYHGFYLWPTPSAAVTYYVDYRREVQDLVNDTDEPQIPTDFHPMLVAYAAWREWEQKGDTERVILAKGRWDKWLSRLKYYTQTLTTELPVLGARAAGHSRLGGWFPADRY